MLETHPYLGFPLGDDLKGAKAKSFDIAGAMKQLYPGFEGTHTFAFAMTDAKGLTSSASLTLIVDPEHENNAPTVVWEGYDIDKRYTISEDTPIDINIAAEAGIKSLVVKIVSQAVDLVQFFLCFRNNNRCNNICPDSCAAEAGQDYPGQADQGWVNIEILGNSAAHTTQHTVYG